MKTCLSVRRTLRSPRFFGLTPLLVAAVAALCGPQRTLAQDAKPSSDQASRGGERSFPDGFQLKVYHLVNVATPQDAGEIVTALRNMIPPSSRIYLLNSTNDVAVLTTPEVQSATDSLIKQLDRPKHAYRLTWTLAESDNGKRVGIQHFTITGLEGQHILVKQGDKVPVATGSYSPGSGSSSSGVQTQMTYLDVGVNIDVTLTHLGNGLEMKSKVEQSSVAPETQNGRSADDPILRQSVLEGTSVVPLGKPVTVGSIDLVGSSRHTDVEVVVEPLP